jgi:hypothetical protein
MSHLFVGHCFAAIPHGGNEKVFKMEAEWIMSIKFIFYRYYLLASEIFLD